MKTITKDLMSFLESTTSITGGSIYDTTVSDKFGGRYEAIVLSWCSFSYETGPDYCDWRKFESIVKNVGFERWGNVSEEHDETQYEGMGSVVFILTESYKDLDLAKRRKSWENTKSYISTIKSFWKMGYSSFIDYILIAVAQTVMFLIPVKLQHWVYKKFLRK